MKQTDILIVTAPYTETEYPLQAPAIIKASVEQHGYTANTYDINHNFIKMEKNQNFRYYIWDEFLLG